MSVQQKLRPEFEIDDEWCRHIPQLHQIIAGAVPPSEFPDLTRALSTSEACSVWETLHYLLQALLGWKYPGNGLRWWYQNGQPVEDSELLRLVSDIWGREQAIDYYAAWVWNTKELNEANAAGLLAYPNEEWWRTLRARAKPRWREPFHGGTNPLHLGHSDWYFAEKPENDECELYHNTDSRRAVLIVNHIRTWQHDLRQVEQRLPNLGQRSWYVRVFDRQYGFLGVFRRSRITGRWFQGKHSIHMVGNASE